MKTIIQFTIGQATAKLAASFMLSFFFLSAVFAGVIVSPSATNTSISADKAANAFAPEFTKLDDIIIREARNDDFASSNGSFRTLILTAPVGWIFRPASAQLFYDNRGDVRIASMTVDGTTVAISVGVTATRNLDAITIKGLEVQALDGASINCPGKIHRSSINPGTARFNGIKITSVTDGSGGTAFATLDQTSGSATKLVFSTKPGQAVAGTILDQQPVLVTQDQFGNATTTGLRSVQQVKIKLASGTGSLAGTLVFNIGTAGGNGIVVCDNIQLNNPGTKKLIATSGDLTFAVTNEFSVSEDEMSTLVDEENADWICRL